MGKDINVKCTKTVNVAGKDVFVKGEKYKGEINSKGFLNKEYSIGSRYGFGVFDKKELKKYFKII